MRIIEVVPYNPKWPQLFEAEAKPIKQALGDNGIVIYHIGSIFSSLGLSAKPIIDILPAVKDILEVDTRTKAMEYSDLAKAKMEWPFGDFSKKAVM